jgi:phage gp45-like
MTQELAEAIVKVYNAARELQNLAAEGTEEEVLKKLMEIQQYAMEGMLGAIK